MRNLNEVIDSILPLIPDGEPLRDSLQWLKRDSSYKPPEQMWEQWGTGGIMLSDAFQSPPSKLSGWQRDVYELWMGRG